MLVEYIVLYLILDDFIIREIKKNFEFLKDNNLQDIYGQVN